jgi:hypothetical protein
MHDLVILTTAVDRPELHSKVFPATLNYLEGLNCKWFITINNINGRVRETKENFERLLSDYDVTFTTYETGGTKMDFMHSCEKLSELGYNHTPRLGYFWLEDDWKVKENAKLKDDIENQLAKENCYISLNGRNELSFNPGIWSVDLFERMVYNKLQKAYLAENYGNQKVMNPERICVYPKDKCTPTVKNFRIINRYLDVGEAWRHNKLKGIQTWKLV